MFWSLPEGASAGGGEDVVVFIDSHYGLQRHRSTLDNAMVLGIDCEWDPTGTSGAATLVQLSTWAPGVGVRVLLLDALALSPATLKAELQPLLRRPSLLKLGYCLAADLRALGAAIGPEGGGAVAVVQPALDLAGLHRQLLQRGAPIRQAGLPGLSGLVQAQLGLPLDKSLQCSAWGGRPLAPEQLRYAATDAAVLLALLASLAEAAPPAQWPLVDTAAADGPLRRQEGGDGSELGAGSGRAPACPAKSTADPLAGWTEADVRGAAAAWGRRLEPGAARSGRSVGKPKTPRGKAPPALPILPPEVPWACGGPDEAGLPRFICDVMAEGLARQLRLVGVDAEAVPCAHKMQRHLVHRSLVERAEEEGRVVLTRDRAFLEARHTARAYLLRSERKRDQLREVVDAFGLCVLHGDLLSRCCKCNGEFDPEPRSPACLPKAHGVPPAVLGHYDEFWVCTRCEAVYWQGGQYGLAVSRLADVVSSCQLR